ncbi:glycosyl transferase [Sinorhizobium sp. BJ1]|nr:glycosyl transferase [Sinorhizobium sp. BJ1]
MFANGSSKPMPNERPIRILHCFRSPIGGIFRHVRDLAEAHAEAGHQVGILCDSTTGGSYEDALFDEIRPLLALGIVRTPIHRTIGPSDIGALWRSYKQIRSLQPDVLHGHGAKGGVLARIIGSALRVNKYRVARLYSPHGGSLHYERGSLTGGAIFRMERLQERLTDALVFVCDFERQTYFAKVGRPVGRNELIYNGIGDTEFAPVAASADAADFLYIGMMRDLKGPDLFIEGFAKAEGLAGRPLSGVMIGDGPQQSQYEDMIAGMGLGDRVRMLPAMKARDAFALARTVVIPSRAESMPYILLEALAAGKPVIASRVGGMPEVLGADSAALVEPADARALADVMAAAVDQDWAARTMPDTERFKSRFSAAVMTRRVMQLYRELTEETLFAEARLRTT